MAAPIKCPKGHWYTPDPSGKVISCPKCEALARSPRKTVSDDDVLAILDSPVQVDPSAEVPVDTGLSHTSLHRRKKVCPTCSYETSLSFGHCPRCGGPLKVASIDI
jgi:hypothetical protein